HRARVEWRLARDQGVQRRPEAVDIGTGIDVVQVEGLLGRDIVGRAHDRVLVELAGQRLLPLPGEPGPAPVQHPDRARGIAGPVAATSRLPGLMSRWTSPAWWAWSSPSAAWHT